MGETVSYKFTVRNTGTVTLTNVTVVDPDAAISGGPITLNAGAADSTTFTGTHIITLSDISANKVTNSATARANTIRVPLVTDVSDSLNPGDDLGTGADPTITPLVKAPILASPESVAAIPGAAGAANVLNVFTNDTFKGLPLPPSGIVTTIDPSNPLPPQLTFNLTTGQVGVNPGTATGTYDFAYKICEAANLVNCSVAVVTVGVDKAVLVANPDSVTGINGIGATPNVLNLFGNDLMNAAPLTPSLVTLTLVPPPSLPPELTLDPVTGAVGVLADTLTGTYGFSYQICENINPTNCATSTASVGVVNVNGRLSGTVYHDTNGSGVFDAGDLPAGVNYIVELVDSSGVVVATRLTNAAGQYAISAAPGTNYKLVFRNPLGGVIGGLPNLTIVSGEQQVNLNLAIDPSGVVYDSATRAPVAGVKVTITDKFGIALPDACLIDPSQQNQITPANGSYRFDLVPNAVPASCPSGETEYRLAIVTTPDYLPGISLLLPPASGALDVTTCIVDAIPGGACQISGSALPPQVPATAPYYMAFLLQAGDPHVVNNHLPIDPIISTASSFTKKALVVEARRGERVPYVIEAFDVSFSPSRIVDVIPAGFNYVAGSSLANGVAIEPTVSGNTLTYNGLTRTPSGDIKLELVLISNAAVTTGPHVNNAQLINPRNGVLAATAKATVTIVAEHVFDCGDIIGKVFDDVNRNGYQDKGEPGLAGVRLVTVKGALITTDKDGLFHIACADIPDNDIGSNFILKLDTRTLPTGYRLTTENPAIVRLTRGKAMKLNFGASVTRLVRFDMTTDAFITGTVELKPQWLASIDKLLAVLAQEKSSLRLTYFTKAAKSQLAGDRAASVEKLIAERWAEQAGKYHLPIETRVVGSK